MSQNNVLYALATASPNITIIASTHEKRFEKERASLEKNGMNNLSALRLLVAVKCRASDSMLDTFKKVLNAIDDDGTFALTSKDTIALFSMLDGTPIYPILTTAPKIKKASKATRSYGTRNVKFWKAFYEHADLDPNMKKLFGSIHGRPDNKNHKTTFALGYGNNCRIEVARREREGELGVQVWCKNDTYYSSLLGLRAEIEKACSGLSGEMEWDKLEEDKTSRKVEVSRRFSKDRTSDFDWACKWICSLAEAVKIVLA